MATNKRGISGRNIYVDKRNRIVYYDMITKKGYIIDPKEEEKYKLYQNRFVLIFCAMILCFDFFSGWLTFMAGLAVSFLIIELVFRFAFLNKLRTVANVERAKHLSVLDEVIQTQDKKRALLKATLYSAFGILIIVNAYSSNYETIPFLACIGVAVFAFYYVIVNLIGFSKIK